MLYLIYGNDFKKRNKEARKLLSDLVLPDTARVDMDADSWSERRCDELLVSQSLFSEPVVAVLSGVFENDSAREFILKKTKEIALARARFVVIEGALTETFAKKMSASAEKVVACEARLGKKIPFNVFALADALAERNKKKLWIALARARYEKIPMEQIHGTLFWQMKALILAKIAENGDASAFTALKPFVQQKARQGARNFSREELRALSKKFVDAYHAERAGGAPLDLSLEEILLAI